VNSLRDELDEARRIRFKPKKEQKIWEWIEENCELPLRVRLNSRGLKVIAWTNYNVDAALSWLRESERNNWSVSQLRKQIRLDQADKSSTLTIKSLNHSTLYQHINSLYSFVKSCDVDEDASVLDKLEEDARSLIKVIGEKRNTRTRELVGV